MAIKYDNVIVFGPTGQVGGAAAAEAGKRGAKVWLAMRDTDKTIGALSGEQERNGQFARVKADLSDPASIKQAIERSGAKAAFVYLIHTPGGIKAALQTMKDAGVEYVVFLSSFTIPKTGNMREIPPSEVIPFVHAQAEAVLEDLDIAHTALRPGAFSSNPFNMSMDYSKTPIEAYAFGDGKREVDNIVPEDIGRVGGAVLVDRPSSASKEIIYLFGPELKTELEVCDIIKKNYPKEVKLVQQTPDEWAGRMKAVGLPPPFVDYMLNVQERKDVWYDDPKLEEGAGNIKKYAGYEPTKFEDFVKSLSKSVK